LEPPSISSEVEEIGTVGFEVESLMPEPLFVSLGAMSMVERAGLVTVDGFGEGNVRRKIRKERLIKDEMFPTVH
jgi:hypothetical protein